MKSFLYKVGLLRPSSKKIKNYDQKFLTKIATTDKDFKIRKEAVREIKDQKTLKKIAMQDSDSGVRSVAIKMIEDQEVLTNILFDKNSEYSEKIAAIKSIQNQSTVEKVAASKFYIEVCRIAFDKIREKKGITLVACESPHKELRLKAVSMISDQNELAKVITEGFGKIYREEVDFENFSDVKDNVTVEGNLSFDYVKVDDHDEVALKAAEKISDSKLLKQIALNKKNIIRGRLFYRLDQHTLKEIASNIDEDPSLRKVAIYNIKEVDFIRKIAKNEKNILVSSAASKQLEDLLNRKK